VRPSLRPLHERHEPAQLEIRNGLVKTQAFPGKIYPARFVTSQEPVRQPVEVIQRAEVLQTEEPEMSAEVGDVEPRIVLAKLVEVQAGELIAVNDDVFGSEIAVGGAWSQAG